MKIKVLVNGAFGRMGQITAKAIGEHPQLELVGQVGREYDLAKTVKDSHAQVVVDFTHPDAVYQNVISIFAAGARPVIGTSGLTKKQVDELQQYSSKYQLGGIIAPNFSIGAVLMMIHAKAIAKYMPNVEIIEMHHDGKADSPSGTAIRTAEMLAEGAEMAANPNHKKSHETIAGARGANHQGIPIHAIRLPGLLAHEQVIFGEPGETLTLRHDSIDRACFMPGVCLACVKVMDAKTLLYGLETIL